MDELTKVVLESNADIMGISEANLPKFIPDGQVEIPGYNMIRGGTVNNDQIPLTRVVVYVRDNLDVRVREDLMSKDQTSVWLDLVLQNNRKLCIGQFYREFSRMEGNGNQTSIHDQHRQWDEFLATWVRAARGGETVVLGDFNIDFVTWVGNNTRPQDSYFWSEIVDKVIPNNFTQVINSPTRYHKPTDTHTLLDHIWVNCPTKVVS